MDLGFINGQTEKNIKECGKMENNKVKEHISFQMDKKK